ncbi:hypothetical protein [Mycobacterium sp. M23085]
MAVRPRWFGGDDNEPGTDMGVLYGLTAAAHRIDHIDPICVGGGG